MKRLEKMIREDLLAEHETVCLSLFVPAGEVRKRCDDLKELIVEATEFLRKTYSASEVEKFISPLAKITRKDVSHFEGAIAFFRSMGSFRAIGVPVEIQKECIVSNHFHIKPLLKWLQTDREFFCIDFSKSNVDILRGDGNSFSSVGCFGIGPRDYGEIDACVSDKADEHQDTLVFLSGNSSLAKNFKERSKLKNIDDSVIDRSAYHGDYEILWHALNDRMRHRAIHQVKKSLRDYNVALIEGNARSEIDQIISAAKNGNIKKLIISEEDKIWGRFDAYKNNVNRVNRQINYEDDDLLDSISEKVIEDGGEVVMASSKQLPKGKALLAILRDSAA